MNNIKKYLTILFLFISLSNIMAQEFEDSLRIEENMLLNPLPKYDYIVSTNPFIMLWGCVPFSSEFRVMNEIRTGPRTSVNIGGAYLSKGVFLWIAEHMNQSLYGTTYALRGYRAQVMYKFYFSKWALPPEGLYICPYFSLAEAKFSYQQTKILKDYYQIRQLNYNLIMGYQFKFMNRFTSDIFFGFGYKDNTWVEHQTTSNFQPVPNDDLPMIYNSHFKFVLGLNVGFIVN